MSNEPLQSDAPEPPPVRRRVLPSSEPQSREGRTGCLIVGAILGIAAGALFTFFALPPVLDHYFGERHIGVGGTYTVDGTSWQVRVQLRPDPPADEAIVSVRGPSDWAPNDSDVELEDATGQRTHPLGATGRPLGPPIAFTNAMGDGSRTLEVPLPSGPRPAYLHLRDLNVRFELPPASP